MLTLLPGSPDSDVIATFGALPASASVRLCSLDFVMSSAPTLLTADAELFVRGDRAFARDDELLQHDGLRLEREVRVDRARTQRDGNGLRLESLQTHREQRGLSRRTRGGHGEAIRSIRLRLRTDGHLVQKHLRTFDGRTSHAGDFPVSNASPCASAKRGAATRASNASTDRTRNLMRPPLVDCLRTGSSGRSDTVARTMAE